MRRLMSLPLATWYRKIIYDFLIIEHIKTVYTYFTHAFPLLVYLFFLIDTEKFFYYLFGSVIVEEISKIELII